MYINNSAGRHDYETKVGGRKREDQVGVHHMPRLSVSVFDMRIWRLSCVLSGQADVPHNRQRLELTLWQHDNQVLM